MSKVCSARPVVLGHRPIPEPTGRQTPVTTGIHDAIAAAARPQAARTSV